MSLATIKSAYLHGTEVRPAEITVGIENGIPGISILGMPENYTLDAGYRIRAALKAAGYSYPNMRLIVNVRTYENERVYTNDFDLAIAAGILRATEQIPKESVENKIFLGELGLIGRVEPIRGDVAFGNYAAAHNMTVVCNAHSALNIIDAGGKPYVMPTGAFDYTFDPKIDRDLLLAWANKPQEQKSNYVEYGDITDNEIAKRALCAAAVGNLNVMLIGRRGTYRQTIGLGLASILPPMTEDEIAEAKELRSCLPEGVYGKPTERLAVSVPSCISLKGLVGGGKPITPGLVTACHNGVMVLDECDEFKQTAFLALRNSLETGEVSLVRVGGLYNMPAKFQLVETCEDPACSGREFGLTELNLLRQQTYNNALSDKVSMYIDVIEPTPLLSDKVHSMTTKEMQEAVIAGKEFQAYRESKGLGVANTFTGEALDAMSALRDKLDLSSRTINKAIYVARAYADLNRSMGVGQAEVAEALSFRNRHETKTLEETLNRETKEHKHIKL